MSEKSICRWGILGTAGIARKNWGAIRNSGNGIVAAVSSRNEERARQFIRENMAQVPLPNEPRALGSYEAMIADPGIDAVYIPLPTGVRKNYAVAAAQAGKHVLCEKPCGKDTSEVREIIDACQKAGVQFMDGVMFMHSERLRALRAALDEERNVGKITRIVSQFSFRAPEDFLKENIRMHSGLEPLGCLGDLGWYNIRFALWAMNYALPEGVTGRIISQSGRPDSPDAVPLQFSGELFFPGNVSASFYCSFETEHQQWANISGSRGHIHLRDFVLPFYGAETSFEINHAVFEIDGCFLHMEDHARKIAVPEYSDSHATSQETKLFRHFAHLVNSGTLDPHWPAIALQTQQVLDACLRSARERSSLVAVA